MIKHVFVVMLENRSFDHMLGLSNITGTDAVTGKPTTIDGLNNTNNSNPDLHSNKVVVSAPADWTMLYDPGHSFADVKEQLCGRRGNYPAINNSGFVTRYSLLDPNHPSEIMKCFSPNQLPVLTTLAEEFAVCDRWFSSVPGPTWPNRFFVHAASSGGLDDSPNTFTIASFTFNGYKFDNGTIFDRLDAEGIGWKIYAGDEFPQVLSISGMPFNAFTGHFSDFNDFSRDVSNPGYSPGYTFIEPNYGHTFTYGRDFACGTSQHPKDDVTRGDRLLKNIYEAIRNSPHWENSVLVIMYDEHGGFYDHVHPPTTVAPGDSITDPENNHNNFDFKQLGVRVPAVIVSPLIPKGMIDHTVYDHTSVLATLENIFGLQALTNRDKHANTFKHLFSLTTPRTDAPKTLPEPAHSGIICEGDVAAASGTGAAAGAIGSAIGAGASSAVLRPDPAHAVVPVDPSLSGFVHVAFLQDMHLSPPQEKEQQTAKFLSIQTNADAQQYMDEVRQKVNTYKATMGTKE